MLRWFFLLALIVAIGCQQRPPWFESVFLDSNFRNKVAVLSLERSQEENDLLRVDVALRNVSARSVETVYKFSWRTKEGQRHQGLASSWENLQILPNSNAFIVGIAPNESITDFFLEILSFDTINR